MVVVREGWEEDEAADRVSSVGGEGSGRAIKITNVQILQEYNRFNLKRSLLTFKTN